MKEIAIEEEIPLFQPQNARDPELVGQLGALEPDISVVVAYGHILPQEIIDLPAQGTLNIHASILPLLRGAAPIQAAIQQGFTETGVTIMRVVKALDAGPIILQARSKIFGDETYGELQVRLSELGALSLIETLALISIGKAKETPQEDALATYAGKVTRESARIDWSRSALEISRLIRAYDPKPGAFTTTPKGDVKLFGPKVIDGVKGTPGEVLEVAGDVTIACGADALRVSGVQPSGKSRMSAHDWVRGRGAAVGERLGA